MKTSPLVMASIYFFMGVLFTFIAIESTAEDVWNFTTIILVIVATFDFGVCLRLVLLHFKIKKIK
ncbi:YdiK family protein, partial [Bacillaceae bacterium S4-13-58]